MSRRGSSSILWMRSKEPLTGGLLQSETEPYELSAEFVFAVLVSSTLGFLSLPLHWVSFSAVSTASTFAKLGFC